MRMTRENLRGELLVSLEAVAQRSRLLVHGNVQFEARRPKDQCKSHLRYAPSFIAGKASIYTRW